MEIQFDPSALLDRITELQRVQIPGASVRALNQAVYDSTKVLSEAASSAFQSPTPFTLNAFKYDKGTIDSLVGRIYIRDEASGGNPPSKYLLPQIEGKGQYPTRFQGAMLNTVVKLGFQRAVQVGQRGQLFYPSMREGTKARINKYGNMSPGQFTQILSSLRGGVSSADLYSGSAKARKAKGDYIFLDEQELNEDFFRNRFTYGGKPGIYNVLQIRDPNLRKSKKGKELYVPRFYRVMTQGPIKGNRAKFAFMEIAKAAVTESFNRNFRLAILR